MEQKLCAECEEPEIEKKPPCPLQCGSNKCKADQIQSKFDPQTKPIVWVLGGPACGKFTQCKKIIEKYGFTHLSTGDIIRDEVESGSPRAKCLTSIMNRGGLAPNALVLDVLKKAMEKAAEKGTRGYLVDGYPREKGQGIDFERTVGEVSLILFFDVSVETLMSRLNQRMATSTRTDDNMQTMKVRIATFLKNNQGVLDLYRNKVAKINAEQAPDAVFVEVQRYMDPIVAHAAAIEAEIAKAEAFEKAKAMAAYARSSTNLLGSTVNMPQVLRTLPRSSRTSSRTSVKSSAKSGPSHAGRESKVKILNKPKTSK